MGEVYRARDIRLGRDVALKVLPLAFASDAERLARFEREARVLAALNHPHIATIHGIEDADGVVAIVMELIEGESLAHKLKSRGPLPLEQTLALVRQIAEGLDAAHQRGIVHRDLKPANVVVSHDGRAKILDFGLARISVGDGGTAESQSPTITVQRTQPGAVMGTPAYMSPEQVSGESIDKRTDIWAFGCVLYEMLTARPAFAGKTVSDTLAAVLDREPDWTALPAATPPMVTRLLRRCLDKDPKRRLHDVADARIELEDALLGAPLEDPPSAATSPRRERLPWAIAGALVLVLAGGVVIGWRTQRGTTAQRGPRLSHPVKLTNTPDSEFGAAVSPDGKWVAYYANTSGRTDLWVKFLDGGATSNLTARLNLELPVRPGTGGVAISPDGGQIAFSVRPDPRFATADTWIMPAPVGGVPRVFLQVLQAVQWSPDGSQIIAIRQGSTAGDALVLANGDGTNAHDLVPLQGGRHIHWPAWARDGRSIYFIYTYAGWNEEPSDVYRVSVNGGSPEPVMLSARRAIHPVPLRDGGLIFGANPDTTDLGLWWKPAGPGEPRPLTMGDGEYLHPRLSLDGRKLVATLTHLRQTLVRLPIRADQRAVSPITDGYSGDLDPSFDLRTDRMVFSSTRSGYRNLWLARTDGSEAAPLTRGTAIDERPAISPDGEQVAFVSDRSGRRGIWVISTRGGAPKMLTEAITLEMLTWSSDGKRVIFARPEGKRTGLASVWAVDGKVEPIPTPGSACCVAASPTSSVIAYLEPALLPPQGPSGATLVRLWLKFIDDQGRPLYSDFPQQQFVNGFLAWSPDGKRLAAASLPVTGAASIWIVEPGAQAVKKLADLPISVRPRGLAWSRDGASVITATEESFGDIILFDVSQ